MLILSWPALAWSVLAAEALAEEPLPIDVALSLRTHNGRSPVNLSPDGEWVAHTVQSADKVPRGSSRSYSDTGFPFAEGNSRMEATLDALDRQETLRLGAPDASSWAPVWSPDGRFVAFYSDQDGEAGLWIWERETRQSRRVGDFVVRPFFGFEGVRWSPDSERLLVKILPRSLTLAEANALLPAPQRKDEAPVVAGEPSVVVRRSTAMVPDDPDGADRPSHDPTTAFIRGNAADLAIVDLETGEARRIVDRETVRMASFSPDGSRIVFSVLNGFVPNAQQALFELRVHDIADGVSRTLTRDVELGYGIEWSWSPDSRHLAFIETGQQGSGALVVLDVANGEQHRTGDEVPSFDPGDGEVTPAWSPDSSRIFALAEGSLWKIDPQTGEARRTATVDGWQMRVLLRPSWYTPRVATPDDGRTVLVAAREQGGARRAGLFAVDTVDGSSRLLHHEEGSWGYRFSLATSDSGDVVYVARNQKQVGELWAFDTRGENGARQVSRINDELNSYALGEARLIEWQSADGEPLRGALLLPPGHEPRTPLPLIVWVYGGATGSDSLHRFGLWGSLATFNMHLLATRGYAVLYPDAPLETGRTTDSLVAAVLPGIEAAVEQGYADPQRVAVMGQSFGSLNVLALLTRSDRFRAAIITAAVLHPDLATDYLRSTGYYEKGQGNMGGTLWEHPERYRMNSPLFDFPKIDTPLLIGQGDQDGDLVPAEAIFTALDRLGKEVEYRLYRGESHVITRPANVEDFWERRLEFLAEHLELEVDDSGRVNARVTRVD